MKARSGRAIIACMAKDHIVPQQMIRRFANSDGKLAVLYKPTLELESRLRGPSGVLFRDDYYEDAATDFDEEVLKPIENTFGVHYGQFLDRERGRKFSREASTAFLDWIASMLARSRAIIPTSVAVAMKDSGDAEFVKMMAALHNSIRTRQFEMMRDLISRPYWKWKRRVFVDGGLVLTDNPVVLTKVSDSKGLCVLAPFSSTHLVVGGFDEDIRRLGAADLRGLNAFLAGWSIERVFASERAPLRAIVEDLSARGDWAADAREPLFGFIDRIRSSRSPDEREVDEFWSDLSGSYGPPTICPPRGEEE